MGKLKLNKREIKAVKDSITHWKRDIQAKLKKGVKIKINDITGCLEWADDRKEVPCFNRDCPLCKFYYDTVECSGCPYKRKYGVHCDVRHWREFIDNPCLKTCNGMIKALENILK